MQRMGYAMLHRPGAWRYPALRQSIAGAWAPSLGPSGQTLYDVTGYASHGTLGSGVSWAPGAQGLTCDGTANGTVAMGGSKAVVSYLAPFSISVKVLPTLLSSTSLVPMFLMVKSDKTRPFVVCYRLSQNALMFGSTAWWNAGGSNYLFSSTVTLGLNTWHTITVTWNGGDKNTAANYTCTVNGVPLTVGTNSTGFDNYTNTTRISAIEGTNKFFKGIWHSGYLWNRALLPSEATLLYQDHLAPLRKQSAVGAKAWKFQPGLLVANA